MNRPMQHKPETILAAALLVFHEDGVNVSTATIAKAAGVSNGTLFNYFPNKQALIDALYISIKADLAKATSGFDDADSMEHRMHQIWDRWLAWARENRQAHLVVNLLYQAGLASAEAQHAGLVAMAGPIRVLDEAMKSGLLVDLPLDYLGSLILHHLDQTIVSELDDRQSEIAFHVLWNGITTKTTT